MGYVTDRARKQASGRRRLPGRRPVKVTVGNALDERLREILVSWDALKLDVSRSTAIDAGFRAAFGRDYDAFHRWAERMMGAWVATTGNATMLERYRDRLERWRARFIAAGGHSTGEPTSDAPASPLEEIAEGTGFPEAVRRTAEAAESTLSAVKWIAGAVVVVGIVYAASGLLVGGGRG